MTYTEAYKILGLSPNATEKEIIRAFRQNIVKVHPDKHGGETDEINAEKTRKIIEAKEFLLSGKSKNTQSHQAYSAQDYEEILKEKWEKHYRENIETYLRNDVKSARNIFCACSAPLATFATIIIAMEINNPLFAYDLTTISLFIFLGAFSYGFPAFNIKWWNSAKKNLKEYLKTKNTAMVKYR